MGFVKQQAMQPGKREERGYGAARHCLLFSGRPFLCWTFNSIICLSLFFFSLARADPDWQAPSNAEHHEPAPDRNAARCAESARGGGRVHAFVRTGNSVARLVRSPPRIFEAEVARQTVRHSATLDCPLTEAFKNFRQCRAMHAGRKVSFFVGSR